MNGRVIVPMMYPTFTPLIIAKYIIDSSEASIFVIHCSASST